MNPETIDLITNVIEELIAAIPQIVVVLTTVVYSLNAIKAKVNTFPKITEQNQQKNMAEMTDTKNKVSAMLEQMKNEVEVILEGNKNKVESMLEDSSLQFRTLFSAFAEENHKKVGQTLVDMKRELVDYQKDLKSSSDQTNMLVRQNKMFTDVITALVVEDPKKVVNGVAKAVMQRTNLSKEEMENYPELLIKELPMLENALKEAMAVLGNEKFEEMLKKVGYGKNH
jgi:hypothetical protein